MLSPEAIRSRFDEVQAVVGAGVTVVAATKYVEPRRDVACFPTPGVIVVGENRVQDLEAKHAEYGDAFRWHFIGHLQSNKVKVVNRICELVHSLDSHSAARRLEVPALVQVNLAGEGSKAGVEPEEIPAYLGYGVQRPLDDAAGRAHDPEASRDWFARLRGLAQEHGLPRPFDGDDPGLPDRWLPKKGRPTSAWDDPLVPVIPLRSPCALGDLWSRTLVYFGIAEEDEDFYEDDESAVAEESRSSRATASGRMSAG